MGLTGNTGRPLLSENTVDCAVGQRVEAFKKMRVEMVSVAKRILRSANILPSRGATYAFEKSGMGVIC